MKPLDWTSIAQAEQPATLALRRSIHADPELGLHCQRTTAKLKAALAGLPLDIRDSQRSSGFVARLDGARPGRTVLLRGDMDALPIHEDTGLDFASKNVGHMHACGHDTHSAMLAGAARILAGRRDEFDGTILFMFQPGEEGQRGAHVMIEEGLLDDPAPEAAFAMHIFPNVPGGLVACRPGALMASTDILRATIRGKGGHAAMPHDVIDPVPIACEAVLALQSHVARRVSVGDPIVLSITRIAGGETHNVIPAEVDLLGTLRTQSHAQREASRAAFQRIVTGIAETHGAIAEVSIGEGYPATINDQRAADMVEQIATGLFGASGYYAIPNAVMTGEDFAFVLEKIPGAMAILGVAPAEGNPLERPPIHSARMLVNEDSLARGVAMHCAFATRFLERGFD
jgi:hippurate hydrolase